MEFWKGIVITDWPCIGTSYSIKLKLAFPPIHGNFDVVVQLSIDLFSDVQCNDAMMVPCYKKVQRVNSTTYWSIKIVS